jgi:hypothetical protein
LRATKAIGNFVNYFGKDGDAVTETTGGRLFKILDKMELCPKVCRFRIEAPRLVSKAQPGQFVILRKDERGERVPMSIGGIDKKNGILTVVIQEVGKTSADMNRMNTGDHFHCRRMSKNSAGVSVSAAGSAFPPSILLRRP